jgi:hypothetical protein
MICTGKGFSEFFLRHDVGAPRGRSDHRTNQQPGRHGRRRAPELPGQLTVRGAMHASLDFGVALTHETSGLSPRLLPQYSDFA